MPSKTPVLDQQEVQKLLDGIFRVAHQWMDTHVVFDVRKGLEEQIETLRQVGFTQQQVIDLIMIVMTEKVSAGIKNLFEKGRISE